MPSTNAQPYGARHLPRLTIRTCSGETKTLSEPDETIPAKLRRVVSGVDLSRINIRSVTSKNNFSIVCGAVVVDVQLHAILGIINRVTGRMTLPKTRQKFKSHESLDYVAWTAVYNQTGYYACLDWFFIDYSTALEVRPGCVAEPFAVQHRCTESGTVEIIFWFAMQACANDPNRGYPLDVAPLAPIRCHKLGEDFDETWCYGYEEAFKKFNDVDKGIVKSCLDLAYGGPDRWRKIECKFRKTLGFGLSEEQEVEEVLNSL